MVNFAPVLLEQIEDYHHQIVDCLNDGIAIRDDLLAALVDSCMRASPEKRMYLVRDCLRANRERQINRHAPYRRLAALAEWLVEHPESAAYINAQFLADLLVWYHLAWMGETVKRSDARIKRLLDKEHGYTMQDRRELIEVTLCLLRGFRYSDRTSTEWHPKIEKGTTLSKPSTVLDRRRAGILLHLTSLPDSFGNGDRGHAAYRFIEFLEAIGASVWQILPLGPTHAVVLPTRACRFMPAIPC